MLNNFPKTHLFVAGAASLIVGVGLIISPSTPVEAKRMSVSLDMVSGETTPINAADKAKNTVPKAAADQGQASSATDAPSTSEATANAQPEPVAAAPVPKKPRLNWDSFAISSGDSLSSLFKEAGFSSKLMLSVIHGEGKSNELERLYAGETIAFATGPEGALQSIKLTRDKLTSLIIKRSETGFTGSIEKREPEVHQAFARGEIDGSLYLAAKEAGLNDRLTMEMAGIFGWDIDFVYDVRRGDRFEVLYEQLYMDGERFDTGRILAAKFTNRGEEITALLYEDEDGNSDYYTPDGGSIRKAFLRTPINARVSSPFNLQRRHPVLDVVRPHEGTDYAAATGTPIKAAGDGRIRFAGWKGGYGRTVIIQHGDNISTLYAHMSRLPKGLNRGDKVRQSQTVGYVGSSGMVTGAHLHYEFRVNGSPRNSRTVDLPDASPIPKSEIAAFKAATQPLLAALKANHNDSRLALHSENQ